MLSIVPGWDNDTEVACTGGGLALCLYPCLFCDFHVR